METTCLLHLLIFIGTLLCIFKGFAIAIKLFGVKNKNYNWAHNFEKYFLYDCHYNSDKI